MNTAENILEYILTQTLVYFYDGHILYKIRFHAIPDFWSSLNPNLLCRPKHCLKDEIPGKILVHFKDTSQNIEYDKLQKLKSHFIDDQIVSGSEIYLENFTHQNFLDKDFEFLLFINSLFYVTKKY